MGRRYPTNSLQGSRFSRSKLELIDGFGSCKSNLQTKHLERPPDATGGQGVRVLAPRLLILYDAKFTAISVRVRVPVECGGGDLSSFVPQFLGENGLVYFLLVP